MSWFSKRKQEEEPFIVQTEPIKPLQEMTHEEKLSAFIEELRLLEGPDNEKHYNHIRQFLAYRHACWDLVKAIKHNYVGYKEALDRVEAALANEGIKVEPGEPPKVCNCERASMVTANHAPGCALRSAGTAG
jgi:hypothetical protein